MHLIHRINRYIGWLCPRLRDCLKNEYVAEKRNFEGKCEILKTLSPKDITSADKPARSKEGYLFYNPPFDLHIARDRL